MSAAVTLEWPALSFEDWRPTKETLHRFAQMVGKLRMAHVPFRNHWWHVTLYVSTRGLTTGPMLSGSVTFEVELDFVTHEAHVRTSAGGDRRFALRDGLSCSEFHAALNSALRSAGVEAEVDDRPFDLSDAVPFSADTTHAHYDAAAVERYWRILRLTSSVLDEFRSGFVGKASPIHLFWHTFDLAHARYSGRRAPPIEGADRVTAEAYSHEVIAFGWWPGDERQTPFPAYYSYTFPEPDALREQPLERPEAHWLDTGNGSLAVLPYEAVRRCRDPAAHVLAFYESAYQAGASEAGWDPATLATSRAPSTLGADPCR